ncbi:CPBP family intramembrane metalloprotease [Lentibacter algarum]|uniref:CPBP family intramembrane glutamic endopeptidase n=1 Tax=Lentibacter algarum TaxID=576131 RepID=UPI001C07A533|nr:CPBP family intramembrane glutamic endopeptidase [Lentibacter algarum]MBU2981548.1 CPBP family intramembrane metalloprotease [Lentibacter algarum]
MRYLGQQTLSDAARPATELWRLALGVVLIVACYLALGYTYFTVLAELVTPVNWPAFSAEIDKGSSARSLLAILASFGLLIISIALVLSQLHGRRIGTLFGEGWTFLNNIWRVTISLTGLAAILWLLPEPEMLLPFHNIDYLRWLALLPMSVPLLMIQVCAEELLFRGYLQSQLAARFKSPLVWLLLPSLVFGLFHFFQYDTQIAGGNAWALALSATVLGLATADLTARAGSLAPALALHFLVGFATLLYVAPGNVNYGLALYTYPFELSDQTLRTVWLPYDLMITFVAWLTARLSLGR